MKLLHISDLHIGKTVNGFSMLEEQDHACKQICDYIDSQKPAAVLISGDIYDRTVPGIEAVRLFDDFLTELAKKNVAVMLISGNHDSPERLNYASRLLLEHKLYIKSVLDPALSPVTLSDEYGDVNFYLMPFIKPSGVKPLFVEAKIDSYTDAVDAMLSSCDIDTSKRNVLLSHQFYTAAGVAPIRSESEINPVGGLDAVDAGLLNKFDYVALGHLHGAQNIGERIRYAGSIVKYSFSECRQTKSVTLVELKEKGNIDIKALPLTPLHDMRELRGRLDELINAPKKAENYDYLKIILTDEEDIIDPVDKLRPVYPNIMVLDIENYKSDVDAVITVAEEQKTISPYELFGEFFLKINGEVMTQEQAQIVRELLGWEEEQ